MTNGKRLFRTISKTGALLAGVLLAAFVLTFALVQTHWGKNTLAELAAAALSKDEAREVEVGKLSGWIPFNVQLQDLSISDERGRWLEVEGIRLRWSPFALLGGRLSIHEVTARRVELLRTPQEAKEAHAETPGPTDWPRTLLRVRVGQLAVKRIRLGQDVVGEPAVFALEATVGETSVHGEKETLVRLEQLDQSEAEGASLTIRGLYRTHEGAFTVDARFEEAGGGLVARLAGIEGPLALSFRGHGPARALEAALSARAGGIGRLESQLRLNMEQGLQVVGKGTLSPDPALSLGPMLQIEEQLPFSLSLRIPENGDLFLNQFALQSGGLSLELEAAFHAGKKELEGRYKIFLRDLEPLQPLVRANLKGSAKVAGRFSGPLLRPQTTAQIELSDASLDGAGVSHADAHIDLDLLENLGARLPRFQVAGRGHVEGLVLEQLDDLPAGSITWEISFHGIEEDGIHVSHFSLKSKETSLQLSGLIDPSGPKGRLELSFESDDPGEFLQMAGLDLPWIGPTVFTAFLQGDLRTRAMKTQFQAKSALLGQHLPGFFLLPEKALSYGAELSLDRAGVLTAPRLWLKTAGASLEAQGSFDLEQGSLLASWDALLPDPDSLFSIPSLSAKGSLRWTGAVKGPLSSLNISTEVDAHELVVEEVLLDRAGACFDAVYAPSRLKGDFSLALFQEEKWIKARSDFSLDGHLLELSETAITGFESALKGRATLDLETPGAQGEIRGRVSDLSLLLALLGQDIHGSAQGEAAFRFGSEEQYLAFSIEARSLASPFGSAQSLHLKSRATGTVEHMKGSVDLEIRDARSADGSIAFLAFKAQGDTERAAFQLDAKGHYGRDFEVETSGDCTLDKEVQRLALKHFQAHYGPAPIALTQPTVVIHEKGTLRVEDASLSLGTGSLKGSGVYASSHARIDLDFMDLPLELLKTAGAPALRGRASGSFALEGRPEAPKAVFTLQAVDLGLEEKYFPDLPSPSLDLKGSFGEQSLKADLALHELTPDPLKGSLDFPLTFSLAPFSLSPNSRGPMEVALHGSVPLPHVAVLLGLDDQELEGRAEANLNVAGPMASPRVTGSLRLIDGAYENFRIGTILKEATLLVTAENGRLLIREAGARDGERGSIALHGWFDLSPDRDFPFHIDIALRDATLIRHDTLTATTKGELVFSGNSKGALLSGEITVDPLEVRIPGRLPSGIADLEIIEIHKEEIEGEKQRPVPEMRSPLQDPFLQIRVTLIIPGRAHLTGRGLDSEWQGKLDIRGFARDASLTGELSVIRGHFNFLGKRLDLTRGVVSFPGDLPPSPVLDVTAEARTREITVFLALTGKVDSPDLVLTSQPPLPSDEILSRLLFGRSVTQISPLQAVQLAHALDVLAGRRRFDLIDHTRRVLGLDLLEIRDLGVEMDEAALRAGKYLAENVYIQVEQGLGPESGRASLQWEVTPNITIQTEVGINAEAGAGVQWRWDY